MRLLKQTHIRKVKNQLLQEYLVKFWVSFSLPNLFTHLAFQSKPGMVPNLWQIP